MSDHRHYYCESCGRVNRVPAAALDSKAKCGGCGRVLDLRGLPVEMSDAALADLVAASPVPIVVDFWAPWCGPCRAMAPALQSFAASHAGRVIVAKVNTDRHPRTAADLGVQAIPTVAVYADGVMQRKHAGAMRPNEIARFVEPFVA